jgi:hypothetical protein
MNLSCAIELLLKKRRSAQCFLFLYVKSLVTNQYLRPLNEFAIITKYDILKISHWVMNRKEKIHNLSFKYKKKFKLLSKNKTGVFNVKYIQQRDGSARLAGIDHMIFSN